MQHSLLTITTLFLFFLTCNTLAQSPAQAPSPPPAKPPAQSHSKPPPAEPASPTDTVAVLLKAGKFITFIRLIKETHVDTQLFSQLNSSTDGITMFAPNNDAFTNLKEVSLDSLDEKKKLQFVQYHILPRFLTLIDFQTVTNPLMTLAGSVDRFPLTITTSDNAVNISTGLSKSSVTNTVYTDKQVAIYEVDKVLIPKNVFPPPAAPSPAKGVNQNPAYVPDDDQDSGVMIGSVVNYTSMVSGVFVAVAIIWGLW